MKIYIGILISIFLTSCASVGAVIDGGKDLATSTVDSVVTTTGNVSSALLKDVSGVVKTAADSVEGLVGEVVEEVDKQTDELQEKK